MDQLQGAVEQLQEDGCNAMTGSFHNPAHNCSHIVYNNPNATSGMYVCTCTYKMKDLKCKNPHCINYNQVPIEKMAN